MTRIGLIARREYVTNVTRAEFLLLTFGLPLLGLFVAALSMLPAYFVAQAVPRHLVVGVVDETGMFEFPDEIPGARLPGTLGRFTPPQTAFTIRHYRSRDEAAKALAAGQTSAYLVLPADYVETGEVLTQSAEGPSLFSGDRLPPLRRILIRGLLRERVNEALLERVLNPIAARRAAAGPTPGKAKGLWEDMGKLLVPYGFTVIMMMSLFASSGYLLRGISEEKDGRVIEIVLSSVSARELFLGKLTGLSAVGLTQVAVWLAFGMLPATALLPRLNVPPLALALAPLFFLLGFLFYGTVVAGIGALGSSWRESQQISALTSMLVILPVMFFPVLIDAPNGPLAVGLSLFPFSAPLVMMIRLSAAPVPWWHTVLAIALLCGCIAVMLNVSVKLFRTALLMYGKRPSVREVWRWLRAA